MSADEWFCGCCGNEMTEAAPFCVRCLTHLGPARVGDYHVSPWDRTYEAVHGAPCPFYLDRP